MGTAVMTACLHLEEAGQGFVLAPDLVEDGLPLRRLRFQDEAGGAGKLRADRKSTREVRGDTGKAVISRRAG